MLRVPAVQALLMQCVAFMVVLLFMYGTWMMAGLQVTVATALLLQGAVAALLSRWRGLAPWWWLIQFLFPAALIAMRSLHLPPAVFLAAFIFLLSLYWTTFRTQVPFYPSGSTTWDAVADLLPQDQSVRFIDIGSGLGGLILNLADRRPDSIFVGIELAPLPWFVSLLRTRLGHSRGRFIRGDYGDLNFAHYDVVFAYLSPAAMPALWEKARTEMRSGTLLLSYEFPIPTLEPDIITMPNQSGRALYGWCM